MVLILTYAETWTKLTAKRRYLEEILKNLSIYKLYE